MQTMLWVNTVVSVIGAVLGVFFAMGSVISIANMQVAWAGALLVAAFLVPVAFVLSLLGSWWAYLIGAGQYVGYWVASPWVYLLLFVVAMLVTFKVS